MSIHVSWETLVAPSSKMMVIPGPTGIFLAALTSMVMVAFALAHEGKSLRVPAPTSNISLALAVLVVNAVPVPTPPKES